MSNADGTQPRGGTSFYVHQQQQQHQSSHLPGGLAKGIAPKPPCLGGEEGPGDGIALTPPPAQQSAPGNGIALTLEPPYRGADGIALRPG